MQQLLFLFDYDECCGGRGGGGGCGGDGGVRDGADGIRGSGSRSGSSH